MGVDTDAELHRFGPPGPPELLIEVPHGATARADFERWQARLRGDLPAELAAYFHVNTDEGAPELAAAIADRLARAGRRVTLLRCRIPRTFIDVNRVVDGSAADALGMSTGLPPYVTDPSDRARLLEAHRRYTARAAEAYDEIGPAGLALALHTYSPRAVQIEVDEAIVPALRRAYRPAVYPSWQLRPPVDLITAAPDGARLGPERLVTRLRRGFAAIGLEVAENASYALHPATTGHRHAAARPGRVLCAELRRDLLGAPWRPFVESRIGPRKVSRVATVMAEALAAELAAGAP